MAKPKNADASKPRKYNAFWVVLLRLLEKREWSQRDLSRVTGINANEINSWSRRPAPPGPEKLQQVAQALEVSVDELLGGAPRPQVPRPEVAAQLGLTQDAVAKAHAAALMSLAESLGVNAEAKEQLRLIFSYPSDGGGEMGTKLQLAGFGELLESGALSRLTAEQRYGLALLIGDGRITQSRLTAILELLAVDDAPKVRSVK